MYNVHSRALKDAAAVINESPSALQVGQSLRSTYLIVSFTRILYLAEISTNPELNQRREELHDHISIPCGYF